MKNDCGIWHEEDEGYPCQRCKDGEFIDFCLNLLWKDVINNSSIDLV
jgi:hypothetical protein